MKRLCSLILVIVIVIFTSSCIGPGVTDGTVRSFSNGYTLERLSGGIVYLALWEGEYEDQVVPPYITDYCYNETFVGIKRITYQHLSKYSIPEGSKCFVLVDTSTREIYGPFDSLEEYENQLSELEINVDSFSLWETVA